MRVPPWFILICKESSCVTRLDAGPVPRLGMIVRRTERFSRFNGSCGTCRTRHVSPSSSSRKRVAWWTQLLSSGFVTEPPPLSPAWETAWCREPKEPVVHEGMTFAAENNLLPSLPRCRMRHSRG